MLAPNCIEFLAVYLAATQIGLYVVPINWHLAPSELEYVLVNSGARALFTHERQSRLVRSLRPEATAALRVRLALGEIEGFQTLDSLMSSHPEEPIPDPSVGRLLVYTSATTGRPKAISLPLSDAQIALDRTIAYHQSSGLDIEHEVHLCASTLYHIGPLDFVACALHMGHKVVLVEQWEPELLLRMIHEHRVTSTFMVPSMFVRLVKLPAATRARYDVTSLKLVVHSAAPCPTETKREMIQWWGPVLREGYGASEGVGTAVSSEEWLRYPGTVGRPIPGSRILILDDDGNEVPPGTPGQIYLTRYQGDRFEYKDDPEKTRAAYRGEFFTVGDIGYVNDEGYLFICDRKIDMIICSGTKIYPAEIEQVLVQHPKIADCAVFGIPDALLGESVKAVIQPLPGVEASTALTSEIKAYLSAHISATKIPRHIEYAETLPRDPNGKLYKRLLRDPHWAGHGRSV